MAVRRTRAKNDDEPEQSSLDPRITAALDFQKRVEENDSENRKNAIYWRKFRYGEQWPAEIQNSRNLEQRPCITVNKTDVYCLSVENQQRQQRPRIRVDPVGGPATRRNADVIQGMIRHIEANKGGADMAYDGGFEGADTEGVGYFRILAEYEREDSFYQELYMLPIEDPLSVFFDDNSVMPDGSDAEEVLIVSDMARAVFKKTYPKADPGENWKALGRAGFGDWMQKDTVRVAEYFRIKRDKAKLVKLSTGEKGWLDLMEPETRDGLIWPARDKMLPAEVELEIAKGKIAVIDERESARAVIEWCKLTSANVLDSRELPGRRIPVFPVYGRKTIIDGKRRRSGLIKNAVGPQQMSNYWKTAATESVAMAPKAKWLLAEGQDEDHENEWNKANVSATATLRYKPTDVEGKPVDKPERIQPEPPPEGIFGMIQAVDNDLSSVLGIIEPAQRIAGNVSGKALQAERLQSDQNTFHLYDNLTRAIAGAGRYLLDVIPTYYPEPERVVRIIGDNNKAEMVTINKPHPDHPDDPLKILNDVRVGQYDVIMDAGPGYNTRRQQAVDSMMPLFEGNEMLMQTAGDVLFANMDFPGAQLISDRLAAQNPLATEIDAESDVPPAAQIKIKSQAQQIQTLQQQLQQAAQVLKDRADVEGQKQAAESHRTQMKEAGATERAQLVDKTRQIDMQMRTGTTAHDAMLKATTAKDIEGMRARLAKEIEAIKGSFALMLAHIDAEAANDASEETTERAI